MTRQNQREAKLVLAMVSGWLGLRWGNDSRNQESRKNQLLHIDKL